MTWEVRKASRYLFAVFKDGKKVSGGFSHVEDAQVRMDALRRAENFRNRPCLCCSQTFLSEGIHNRLCTACRHRRDTSDLGVAI